MCLVLVVAIPALLVGLRLVDVIFFRGHPERFCHFGFSTGQADGRRLAVHALASTRYRGRRHCGADGLRIRHDDILDLFAVFVGGLLLGLCLAVPKLFLDECEILRRVRL